MTIKTEVQSKGDRTKIVAAISILVVAIIGFYYYEEHSLLIRVFAFSAALAGAVALFAQTLMGREVWQFAQESKIEIRKVVWPTRQETTQTTLVVLVMVVIVAFVLWLLDSALFAIVQWLTGR